MENKKRVFVQKDGTINEMNENGTFTLKDEKGKIIGFGVLGKGNSSINIIKEHLDKTINKNAKKQQKTKPKPIQEDIIEL